MTVHKPVFTMPVQENFFYFMVISQLWQNSVLGFIENALAFRPARELLHNHL